jgi:Tol biopolymer transport system component
MRHTMLMAALGAAALSLGAGVAREAGAMTRDDLAAEIPGSKLLYARGSSVYKVVFDDGWAEQYVGTGQAARWSPDGTKIAVIYFAMISVMDEDGSNRENFTTAVSRGNGISIDWHPDGTKIIFTNNGLFYLDLTDGSVHLIANDQVADGLSYDGEPSAASILGADGHPKRYVARIGHHLYAIDPGLPARIPGFTMGRLFDTYHVCSPCISPCGAYLVNNMVSHEELALRDWDGSNLEVRTADPAVLLGGEWDNFHWSNHPDYIAIQGDKAMSSVEAYVYKFSTAEVAKITSVGDTTMYNPDLWVKNVSRVSGVVMSDDTIPVPVPFAEIVLTGPSGAHTTVTDYEGEYAIFGIFQNGDYTPSGTGLTFAGSPVTFSGASILDADFTMTVAYTDADALPDYWEYRQWGEVTSLQGDADDPDADGVTNIDEFNNGTSPLVAAIVPVTEEDWTGCASGSSSNGGWLVLALTGIGLAAARRARHAALARARIGAVCLAAIVSLVAAAPASAAAPKGKAVEPSAEEEAAAKAIGAQLTAKIVWSSSRETGLHNIYIMDEDGANTTPLTQSEFVDWFARFSPDGKQVIFCRSKRKWEAETNAKYNDRWDIYIISVDGTGEQKIIDDATWGTWTPDGSILFSRQSSAFTYDPRTKEEKLLIDGEAGLRGGVVLQQPQMSPDGKHVAITLRGRMRETGIWHLADKTWTKVGVGCQINWFPSGTRMIRMNESTGRGGTEVLAFDVENGVPVDQDCRYEDMRFMDLPGRRSHEYFPQISRDGTWMVWCATDRGHDHDIYDYEVHIWRIGAPAEEAARLTYHTGNDRWPDIFIMAEAPAAEE